MGEDGERKEIGVWYLHFVLLQPFFFSEFTITSTRVLPLTAEPVYKLHVQCMVLPADFWENTAMFEQIIFEG
jgi:hypothetical protein